MFTLRTEHATLAIFQGDLTQADTRAVVNAANARLAGGGGVDGAIHRAAGYVELQAACQEIIAGRGRPLDPGDAVITPGFGLKAPWIIHTVGPIWRGGNQGEPQALARAYANCLALAAEHDLESLAFPAISCGAYGYPVHLAAPLALNTLLQGLSQGPAAGTVREVRLMLHGESAYDAWTKAACGLSGQQHIEGIHHTGCS